MFLCSSGIFSIWLITQLSCLSCASSAGFCENGEAVELAHHRDIADGYFSNAMINTGNENQEDSTQNTFSRIGAATTSGEYIVYLDLSGAYTFKLEYVTLANATQTLIWQQTSWLTSSTISGYTALSVPARQVSGRIPIANFNGLGLQSFSASAYLSSIHSVLPGAWYNSVGTTGCNNCLSYYDHPATYQQNWGSNLKYILFFVDMSPVVAYRKLSWNLQERFR